jgi:hypothetical protein
MAGGCGIAVQANVGHSVVDECGMAVEGAWGHGIAAAIWDADGHGLSILLKMRMGRPMIKIFSRQRTQVVI